MRVYYYRLYNELTSILSSNINSFYIIIINFIINILFIRDLYINNIYDIILILINKLTKYITYIVTIKKLKANELANII